MEETALARRLRGLPRVAVGGREIPVASTRLSRLLGLALLPRELAGAGLLIPRCRSVHSFGMRFAIDVVFLDRRGSVLCLRRDVRAGHVVTCRAASAVLEIPAGGEVAVPPPLARACCPRDERSPG
jgi:uncharacterized membrane protein (UPF0127 family)